MNIIYCYTNKITGTKYIGQTINPEERYNQHKSNAFNPNSREYNSTFHKKIRQYGWDNFIYEILEEIEDSTKLDEAEIKWIAYYDSYHNGYNDTPGGRGRSGPLSDETKKKISLNKEESLTEEEIIAIRKAYANHESPTQYYNDHYLGKMHFNSFLNIWIGRKYKTIMPEVIENGRHNKLTQELANKIREEYIKGNETYQTLADKYKIGKCTVRDVIKGKTWKNNEIQSIEINTNKKRILCIETQKIYDSITEASKDIKRDQSALSKCLNGQTKSCGKDNNGNKLHWQFISN